MYIYIYIYIVGSVLAFEGSSITYPYHTENKEKKTKAPERLKAV